VRRVGELTVYESLDELPGDFGPSAATIGVFDGVHRGHAALLHTVLEKGAAAGAIPTVVTFDRHPLAVIDPGKEPRMLTTLPQRARLMADLGVRALVILHFDDVFRHKTPEDFVREILVERLHAIHVVVGANFRFGHKASGTIETLHDLGAAHGFGVTIFALEPSMSDDVVSSSLIRAHLEDGLVEEVARELARPFRLEGVVVGGAGRGKDLGFPTANLRTPPRMLIPKLGVYCGWLLRGDRRLPAVMNVGINPTFEDRTEPVVEVHVLDFDEDLYGEVVEVEFTHRLRDERKFESPEALVRQMHEDVRRGRELLGT